MDFKRGEVLFHPNFTYPDGDGSPCEKLLLVLNKNHSSPDDVVIVPAKSNIRNYPYKSGCNETERDFYIDQQIGFYKVNTVIQLRHIETKPCGYFEEKISVKYIDRLNKFTSEEEFGRILNCLKRIKRDIPIYIQEMIF